MKIINRTIILNGLILIFSIFPIIPNNIKGLPVILLFVGSLTFYKKSKINLKWLLINSSLFIVYLVSVVYSTDFPESLKRLETALSILILPITFYILLAEFKLKNSLKLIFIKFFIISTTLFSLISFCFIFLNYSSVNYIWSTDRYRFIVMNIPLIGQHPIYASIFLSITIIFFIYLIKNKLIKNFKGKLLLFVLALVNILLLSFLASKGVIISLFVVLFFYFVFGKIKRVYKYLLITIISLSFVMLFVFNRRMGELISVQTYEKFNPYLSTGIRLGIYDCSLEIIKKNWILGYGIGDAQRALNLCYANKSNILLMNRFNSHNQYLDVIIKTGVIGFLIFLFFLVKNLNFAFKSKNELLLLLIIFYSINFLTENLLSRQSGVILFFFLICFFNYSDTLTYNDKDVSKSQLI